MILITGANGLVGRQLVPYLAQQGWDIRVMVRPGRERRVRRLGWPDNVQLTTGSLESSEDLHRAMQGVHTIFHLASAQWWGGPRDLDRVDIQGTRNVIAVARSTRVGRMFYLSQLGAEPASAYMLLRTKGQAEALIRNSGLAYTIIRCGVVFGPEDRFVNGLAMILRTNPLVVFQPGEGETLLHPLYIHDLVKALGNALENIDLVDATIEIGGGEYVSYNELIRTVMRVTNAPRLIVPLPPHLLRTLTNFPNRLLPRWPVTRQWFDLLASNRTAKLSNLFDYCGVRPVRFEDTLLTYMPERHYRRELVRFVLGRRD